MEETPQTSNPDTVQAVEVSPVDGTEDAIRTPADYVTAEQVTCVLRNDLGEGAELHNYVIEDFLEAGQNFASCVTSVVVNYSLNGEEGNF